MDASNQCIGAVISHSDANGLQRIVHVFSEKIDSVQQTYFIADKELLAAVKSIEYSEKHLIGTRFLLETTQRALEYLLIYSSFIEN